MTTSVSVSWPAGNNQWHDFVVYDPKTVRWNAVGGVYIFAKQTGPQSWQALYIGQTENFQARLPGHGEWPNAARLGATHIHARPEQLAATRHTLEVALIQQCQPLLNRQHRKTLLS